ncbi:hypothetical protein GYMLUDRAFT_77416 [Collybiopsis luxurians FD-317 M1]|uniref:Uncharacterized protein n=1 Tax=Collybiopsis luxurians FD-317 M1 TaxID=944289 RepID=A0A0D0C6X0_9AGAR|nr:hypothetical protein GYMLUDRAFT_77416 [Collybiopsis luxurians FD-317 M1]
MSSPTQNATRKGELQLGFDLTKFRNLFMPDLVQEEIGMAIDALRPLLRPILSEKYLNVSPACPALSCQYTPWRSTEECEGAGRNNKATSCALRWSNSPKHKAMRSRYSG